MPNTILRPLKTGEKLDVSLKLWRASFKKIIMITAPVSVPLSIVLSIGAAYFQYKEFTAFANANSFSFFNPSQSGGFNSAQSNINYSQVIPFETFIYIAITIVMTYTTAACFKVLTDTYIDKITSAKDSIKFVIKKIPSLIWVSIEATFLGYTTFLIVIFAIVILVAELNRLFNNILLNITVGFYLGCGALVLFLYILIAVLFTTPIVLVENLKGRKAIKRSLKLTSKGLFGLIKTLIISYILASIISFAFEIVGGIVVASGHGFGNFLGEDLIIIVGTLLLTTTFFAAIVSVMYIDQRVRLEGFDVELLASGLGYNISEVGPSTVPNINRNYYSNQQPSNSYYPSPPTPYPSYQNPQYQNPQYQNPGTPMVPSPPTSVPQQPPPHNFPNQFNNQTNYSEDSEETPPQTPPGS